MLKRIVIASILKPVNDTRMYEKIGISLGNTNKYEVNIIGFYTKKYTHVENIKFYPIFKFHRLSFRRIFAPFLYFIYLVRIKPALIIITTPELLPATCCYKIFFKTKIIYDIQENYKLNILHNQVYPHAIKFLLAYIVRKTEVMCSSHISLYFLAEDCYKEELKFIGDRYKVLKNKYVQPKNIKAPSKLTDKIHLIYTGTIARNYGILEAIHLSKELHKYQENIFLTIAGFCAEEKLYNEVLSKILGCEFIEMIGGKKLLPHEEIIRLIKIADFGLVPYQPDPSIENKIPTKLYEYLANKVPVILQNHKTWVSFCAPYGGFLAIDYKVFDTRAVLDFCRSKFPVNDDIPYDLLWISEEKKLLPLIESLS